MENNQLEGRGGEEEEGGGGGEWEKVEMNL